MATGISPSRGAGGRVGEVCLEICLGEAEQVHGTG